MRTENLQVFSEPDPAGLQTHRDGNRRSAFLILAANAARRPTGNLRRDNRRTSISNLMFERNDPSPRRFLDRAGLPAYQQMLGF